VAAQVKRFDVCPATGRGIAGRGRFVVVLQHEHLDRLGTVVAAPLFADNELEHIDRLRPHVRLGRKSYIVAVDLLAALPKRQLEAAVANLEKSRYELTKAIDLLFAGF
jgi:toxin CcdB